MPAWKQDTVIHSKHVQTEHSTQTDVINTAMAELYSMPAIVSKKQ